MTTLFYKPGPYTWNKERLRQFFVQYLLWAAGKSTVHKVFRTNCGLCKNLDNWLQANGITNEASTPAHRTRYLLRHLFRIEYGEKDNYPFGGPDLYEAESDAGTHHKNDMRLAFVKRWEETFAKEQYKHHLSGGPLLPDSDIPDIRLDKPFHAMDWGKARRKPKPAAAPDEATPTYPDASTYALFVRIPGGVAVLRHRSGRYYQKPVYARWDDDTKNVRLYAMFRDGYLALGGNNCTSDQTVTWRTLVLPDGDRVRETDRLGRPVWAARG